MTDMTLPVWSFRPDWSQGMLEALEWATSVQKSNTGAEQRRSLRLSPRRTIETNMVVADTDRQRFDLAISAAGATNWNIPLWWDISKLTADAPLGTETVSIEDTTTTEFKVGGLVFFRGPDVYTYEVRQVTAKTANTLTLDMGTVRAWKKGTKLLPMKEAFLSEQPTLTRHADEAGTYTANWQVAETNDYVDAAFTEFYRGYPIFRKRPDDSTDLTTTFTRILDTLDNNYAIPKQQDLAGFAFTAQSHQFYVAGKQQMADFRGLLYALRGQITPVWLPTFFADITLARPIADGDTTVTIKRNGISEFFTVIPVNRQDIIFDPRGNEAPAVYRRILGAVDNGDGTETVTVDSAFTQAIFAADLKRISWIYLARLSTDRIEINHQTDNAGVAQVSTIFQSTPETRMALDYSLNRFPNTEMTSDPCICGTECGAWGDSRTNGLHPFDSRVQDPITTSYAVIGDALYNLLLLSGFPPDTAQSIIDALTLQLEGTAGASRDFMLADMTEPPEGLDAYHYALAQAMTDDELHIAYANYLAYTTYLTYWLLFNLGANWSGALQLAAAIDPCVDDGSDPDSLLTTFCMTLREGVVTDPAVDVVFNDITTTVNLPFPVTQRMIGCASGGETNISPTPNDAYVPSPDIPQWSTSERATFRATFPLNVTLASTYLGTPGYSNVHGLNIQVSQSVGAGNSSKATYSGDAAFDVNQYMQPGCSAVPVIVQEGRFTVPSVNFDTKKPEECLFYSWFTAVLVTRDAPWPAKVKFRIRNSNGQELNEYILHCYSAAIPGHDGLFTNVIRENFYIEDRTTTEGNQVIFFDDPIGHYNILQNEGSFIFDVLAANDTEQYSFTPQTRYNTATRPNWGGGGQGTGAGGGVGPGGGGDGGDGGGGDGGGSGGGGDGGGD